MGTPREIKGKKIAQAGNIEEKQENVFIVPSQTKGKKYTVIRHYNYFSCSCPDYHYRKKFGKCKHVHAVLFWKDFKAHATKTEQYTELDEASISCVQCGSLSVVRNGTRKNKHSIKPRYKCKACKKFFVLNQEFKGLKGDEKAVCLAMDLYFKGLSLKKISDTLEQFYGLRVHFSTVYRWIERFMGLINDYVDTIQPTNVSGLIHTDETKIKTKKNDWLWAWNSMDADTRFLLASTISKSRYIRDARKHFKEVKTKSPEKPVYIFTDGWKAYSEGIRQTFNAKTGRPSNRPTLLYKTTHIPNVGLQDKPNNNKIERLHGSQKERLKVMRAPNNTKALERKMKSWQTYYNFMRPHEALQGKIPAQASGIQLNPNWKELIIHANEANHADPKT